MRVSTLAHLHKIHGLNKGFLKLHHLMDTLSGLDMIGKGIARNNKLTYPKEDLEQTTSRSWQHNGNVSYPTPQGTNISNLGYKEYHRLKSTFCKRGHVKTTRVSGYQPSGFNGKPYGQKIKNRTIVLSPVSLALGRCVAGNSSCAAKESKPPGLRGFS